jgi:uncharacterized RDD family membrane protein YckC
MTQQDETGQGAATGQSLPSRPSPYLDAGESVPQAYLAPPQPGQPNYGTPPAYRPGLRPRGAGQQPYAQPGYGQPGNGQPGYGQRPRYGQPGGRPRGGMQTRRDPAIAAPWERLAACMLDWIIIVAVSLAAFWKPLARINRELDAIITSQGHLSPAAQAAANSVFRNPANQHILLYWFLAMFGIALVYYWVQHAAWGATIGKRALGVRVVQASDRSRIGVRAAGIRAVAFLVGPAAFLLLTSPINVVGGLLWAADTGLPLLDLRAQCLHDKLAGTIVIRKRWLDQQERSARPW